VRNAFSAGGVNLFTISNTIVDVKSITEIPGGGYHTENSSSAAMAPPHARTLQADAFKFLCDPASPGCIRMPTGSGTAGFASSFRGGHPCELSKQSV
jgi:hypothetical protein